MQNDEFNGVDFIDEVDRISISYNGRSYDAEYIVESGNIRLTGRVERYRFGGHLPLTEEPAAVVAERLLVEIIREKHGQFFPFDACGKIDVDDLEATLAELDRL